MLGRFFVGACMRLLRRDRGTAAGPLEIFLDPRVIERDQFVDRADRDDLLVGQHRDPVADRIQRIEIMRDQEHRQPERLLQRLGKIVERRRTDRVEPRSRLVEEQQFGIERQRTGETGTLLHAARQLGGKLVRGVRRQAGHHHLVRRDLREQRGRQVGVELAQRHFDVLGHGQRREQRTALEQHAPALADLGRLGFLAADIGLAEHHDLASDRGLEADDRAHQHRLAGARAAHDAEDLAAPDVEV